MLTLPALAALRRRWPGAYVELVGYPHIAGLATAGRLVDRTTSLDGAQVARLFSLRPELPEEQVGYIRSFDVIVSYLYDPDGTVSRNLRGAGARQVIYGPPRPVAGHAVEHLMRPLEALAIYPDGEEAPRLLLTEEARDRGRGRVASVGERVLALHPGSGDPGKNWPLAGFLAVADRASRHGLSPVFIVGEADVEIAGRLEAAGEGVPVLSGLSLVEVAESLAACTAYVGNDSGITHLAAALGIPVAGLFGPTDPAVWGPRGEKVRIVSARQRTTESMAEIRADHVVDILVAAIGRGSIVSA